MMINLNLTSMPNKKILDENLKVLSTYMNSVWIDFDNVEEMNMIQQVAKSLKPKKVKRKKKD